MNIKRIIKKIPVVNNINWGMSLFEFYKSENSDVSLRIYLRHNWRSFRSYPVQNNKITQIVKLINGIEFFPVENNTFLYSIDVFKRVEISNHMMDNYSIDYSWVVKSSFGDVMNSAAMSSEVVQYHLIIDALKGYIEEIKKNNKTASKFRANILEIESLFTCPAEHFHEAIQRILFVNQWLWQTGHKHNGFGHLDWILYDLYKKDIDKGYITREDAKEYLKDFFYVLHDKCWFKSTMLLGDTGQIIILGGLGKNGQYRCNELTYLFIKVSKELKLPDPKVLLRVSKTMPNDLLALAMECIATGIGAPFLSNDDSVIPSLIQFGYDEEDAYDYATSACWEPLTLGNSCDQNNIRTVNFCEPFVKFLDSKEFEKCESIEEIKQGYYKDLQAYLNKFLTTYLDDEMFEEDPLLTLFSPKILETGKDIVRGGAKYANLGVTSVGMSTVVNSILNLKYFVFEEKKYSLHELNEIRKNNFINHDNINAILNKGIENFGNDSETVISLTNEIMKITSEELSRHHTKLGGKYKYGLSSPNYIVDSKNIGATFDGRKAGQPFGVHISEKNGLSPTELISFASQLDFKGNRINGNVIDFIMSPSFIRNNFDKTISLIYGGIRQGFYQLQINVVDSKTLIEAQKQPERFSNLVVRVWGFSAYFKDLPKDYQDNLIKRAVEAEMAV